ncbi:MAG: Sel1-like repeat-containing protein kinase family protein [Bacteroidales bacterium]|nr:Sel1-like repeat-containing protein kinase family protein [Bacteroidales bacterium]
MQYPLISEYIDAISMAEDNLDELSHLVPVLDKKGKPVMSGGNFAVVFKMQDSTTGKYYALKCFTREQDTRQENYIKIADELSHVSSSYIIGVRYLPKELFVDTTQSSEEEFPVLLMDWVEGQTLDNYLRNNIDQPAVIRKLSDSFNRMAIWLLSQPFAHGDLKPDNIIVNTAGELVLVDYDGMYVPSMKGMKSKETGSPNFRHPQRSDAWFDETIDDFSLSLMATALYALSLQPALLQQYEAKDAILFTEKDLLNLPQSKLYSSLSALLYDKTFAKLFSALQLSFARVPIRGQYATMFARDEAKQEAYKSLYDQAMKLYQTSNNKTEAYQLLSQAADMDFISKHIQVCFKTDEDIEKEKARIETYTSLATNNDAVAQLILGECYYFGWGVEQDYKKAVEWYKKSAEQGNAMAQCSLGYCYEKGQGVEQDYKKAVEWYKKSAEQGYARAQCNLGYCYEYGQGVEQDYKKAVEWYKKSAEQGDETAQCNLGTCYEYGEGVEQDYKKSVEWYNKSAEQGYAAAQCNLGYCYEKGQGVEQDYKKSVEWYKKSAEQGYAAAQCNLGYCYEYGQGVEQDYKKAVEWYRKSAEQGYAAAQCKLGNCY